jgi:hypothetical protein
MSLYISSVFINKRSGTLPGVNDLCTPPVVKDRTQHTWGRNPLPYNEHSWGGDSFSCPAPAGSARSCTVNAYERALSPDNKICSRSTNAFSTAVFSDVFETMKSFFFIPGGFFPHEYWFRLFFEDFCSNILSIPEIA